MNVASATPSVGGSAVNGVTAVGPGAAVGVPNGAGVADLFSALLASLQASPMSAPVVAEVNRTPAEEEPDYPQAKSVVGEVETDDDTAATSDVVVPPEPEAGDASTETVDTTLVGSAVAGSTAILSDNPITLPPIAEPGVEAGVNGSEPDAVSAHPVPQPADQRAGPQSEVRVVPTPRSPSPELPANLVAVEPEAELEPIAQPNAGKPAPPLVLREPGVFTAEATRQGQLQGAQAESGSDRTIRRLVQNAIETARARAGSADVAVNTDTDVEVPVERGADDGVDPLVFAKRPASDVIPELRPGSASISGASPNTPSGVAGLAAGVATSDAPASGEVATHARDGARATLPQAVDVRDVGDFTVRSVRYLSGRTEETVMVRLVPRSLGELHLAVRAASDGLEIVLTAANHAARERLEVQMVGLRELLAREGVDVSRIAVQAPPSFDLGSQMPSQHQHHQHHAGQTARHPSPAYREPEHNPPEQQFAGSGRPHHDGGLNMLA